MQWNKISKDIIILSLILGCVFGACLGNFPLHTPDAARYAEIPREMLVNGDFITPHLNGLKYFEKPPLFYWMQVFNFKLFGVNALTAYLANALMAFFTCLIVYLFTAKIYNYRAGFISALILGTSLLFFGMNHVVTTDVALTFFLTTGLLCFIVGANYPPNTSKNIWFFSLTGLFLACAVLTKGLIGVILPAMIMILWVLSTKQWKVFQSKGILYAIVIFLTVAIPWHIVVQIRNPEFFNFYFVEQHFLRYLTTYAGRVQPWWFFPAVLLCGFFPWISFLFQAFQDFIIKFKQSIITNISKHEYKNTWFFIIWVISIYCFYAFSYSRLIPYLLPIFPALAIIVGKFFVDNWQIKHRIGFTCGFIFYTIFSMAIGCVMFALPQKIAFIHSVHFLTIASYISGYFFIFSGIVVLLSYYKKGIATGCKSLLIAIIIMFFSIMPFIAIFSKNSTLPFVNYLQHSLSTKDEVIAFNNYYQDLPFYLQRIITIVNYKGELAFGFAHDAKAREWMISYQEFEKRWLSERKIYMIMDINDYLTLPLQLQKVTYPLLKYVDKILVVNKL